MLRGERCGSRVTSLWLMGMENTHIQWRRCIWDRASRLWLSLQAYTLQKMAFWSWEEHETGAEMSIFHVFPYFRMGFGAKTQ